MVRLGCLLVALTLFLPTMGVAATFAVDRTDDVSDAAAQACTAAPNDCTLRAAVAKANAAPGSTIVVPAGTYTLALSPAMLTLSANVAVTGAGAATTTIDATMLDRVFTIQSGTTVAISGLTLTDGTTHAPVPGGEGGAIHNEGTLTLTDSVVENSAGDVGGGIYNAGTLTLLRTVVSGNTAVSGYQAGGGIENENSGTVTLTESAVRGNQAGANGGGIFNFSGTLTLDGCEVSGNSSSGTGGGIENGNFAGTTLTNTTVSGNMSQSSGGGVELDDSATLSLSNVTIADNVGALNRGYGGGIDAQSALSVVAKNTLIAGNTVPHGYSDSPDCNGTITSQGYDLVGDPSNCTITGDTTTNITGVAAGLGSLALNGNASGPTQTHALLAGSPAINAGDPATAGSGGNACEATDQRGVSRTQALAGRCDIGAYEAVPPPTTTTTTATTTTTSTTTTSTTTATSIITTTSTTTTTHLPTTTTTLPAGDCGSEPVSATFASIDCRLVALLARVTTDSNLSASGPKLVQNLSKAKDAEEAGASACAASDLKHARQGLKQAIRDMIEYAHHLQTLRARKKLPGALRTDLLAAGNPITDDAKSLKRTVQCPADAPQ